MKPVLTIILAALMLAACADGYDKPAVPAATTVLHQASDRCKAMQAAKTFQTYSEREACELSAARAFFMRISLKRMEEFEAYATSRLALAADRDAGRVTAYQLRFREAVIFNEFLTHCGCKQSPTGGFVGLSISDRAPPPIRNILGHRQQ